MGKNNIITISFIPILFIMTLFVVNKFQAQTNYNTNLPSGLSAYSSIYQSEPVEVSTTKEKNYVLPAVEIVGLNLFLGAFNTYVSKEDFAKISWRTIEDNFKTGFVWDEDHFLMNQFLH
ncbi:MAG TPA: hypothetical protein ENN33_07810, partial [Ignavibacteria bacterium]|nr:hypothetical protein [Ignavibacteria bacterium]